MSKQPLRTPTALSSSTSPALSPWIAIALFALVACIGLTYVKWAPYYDRVFTAASTHSIGSSILTGKASAAPAPSWEAALGYAVAYFNSVWKAVVLGLLLGSLVQVLIPRNWVQRFFGGNGFGSMARAGIASLPGMMCSCCAAPVAVGLRASSASPGAALAFFLGNPVLNPATIIFMGFVLSWEWALFRVVAGTIMVFAIAALAGRFALSSDLPSTLRPQQVCLPEGSILIRWLHALYQLIIDTIPAYLIVVFLLGAFRAWLFPAFDPAWSDSIAVIIMLAITGTLFVIPTAAEIPIVQSMLAFGLGIGPAATLLVTLPAVSLPSLFIIRRAFPAKVLILVALGVIVAGILSGLAAKAIL